MRLWYVVGTVEYWLEPEYSLSQRGMLRILGARLYDAEGKYKGYWRYPDFPLPVKRQVRSELTAYLKREKQREKHQVQALHSLRRRPLEED